MKAKLEQLTEANPNPVLSVAKNDTVLYSNVAGEPLLHEWGVTVGEKLPSYIGDVVQRVLCQNSPEKMEVKAGKRTYQIALHPSLEQECVNVYGFDISGQKELEVKPLESEVLEIANVELSEILDIQAVKPLMEDLYKLVHIPIGINDLKGNVLVSVGWQDICTKFHRVHPEAFKHCVESDTKLSSGVHQGEFKLYKCKNNMWDIVTPIMVSTQHVGYVFSGQFFYDDEPLDYELFRSQARKYGFNEEEYITALEKVPRLSRETVNTGMSFFMTFANMLSQLSYSNIKLAKSLSERDTFLEGMQESEGKYRKIVETANEGVWVFNSVSETTYINEKMAEMLGYNREEMIGRFIWDFADEEDKGIFQVKLANRKKGIDEVYECKLIRKDGLPVWFLVSAKASFDDAGKFAGSLGMFTDITDRKRVEQELRESKARVESIFRSAPVGIGVVVDRIIKKANERLCEMTGYSREELLGKSALMLYPTAEEYERVGGVKYGMITEHGTGYVETRWQRKDSSVVDIFLSSSPIVPGDLSGEITFTALDITERKHAEEALKRAYDSLENKVKERTLELEKAYNSLKESEKGLAEAQRMTHIGNWDWNIVTNGLYWSDEIYRIFGRSPQEFGATYEAFLSNVHPDDRDYVNNKVIEALSGKPFSIDHRIILANEEERLVHEQGEVIFDEKNTPIRMRGTVQDITELKKSEEKIETLANIVESSSDAIMTGSLDGIVTSWNKGAEQIYGYSAEEILGQNASILEPDHLKREVKKFNEKIKRGEKVKNYETLRLKKDGTPINVSVTLSPIFDASGKLTAISVIARDITERIKAEKSLMKTEGARKKEIHHRIKNNLQVISSLLDLQADKFNDTKVIEAFRESQSRVISMALIHEELYKEEGTDTLNFSEYLKMLANNLFQTYILSSKNILLNMDLEENVLINMDTAVPLGIIVNELVSNSLKHAFPGRDKGEIRIKLHKEERDSEKSAFFTLTVSDDGVGIPENIDIEKLDSLGLQLVTSLVDQLDGVLELKRDNGTEFTLRFTVTEKNNQASPVAQQSV